MATAISLGFSVGDTVYKRMPIGSVDFFYPVTGVVSQIKFTAASDVAVISFVSGSDINHSTASQTALSLGRVHT